MGQGASYFTEEEQKELLQETGFSQQELMEIQKRYSKLDESKSSNETNGVTVDVMMSNIPELAGCKLARLVAEKLGGRTQTLYPRETVTFFNELSSHKTPMEKTNFLFTLLDVKMMGFLSGIEIYRFYHALLSPSLSNQQIKELTENLLKENDGQINPEKFKEIFPSWEVAEKLTVDLEIT